MPVKRRMSRPCGRWCVGSGSQSGIVDAFSESNLCARAESAVHVNESAGGYDIDPTSQGLQVLPVTYGAKNCAMAKSWARGMTGVLADAKR